MVLGPRGEARLPLVGGPQRGASSWGLSRWRRLLTRSVTKRKLLFFCQRLFLYAVLLVCLALLLLPPSGDATPQDTPAPPSSTSAWRTEFVATPSSWSSQFSPSCRILVKPSSASGEDVPARAQCLPSLVVMGAQKSGTTALHAFLSLHPNLVSTANKELHVWDSDAKFESLSVEKWRSLLPEIPLTSSTRLIRAASFESSPSYMASLLACQRMARYLPSDTKFVVVLRNPTERIWSEIEMKKRRISEQEEMRAMLPLLARELAPCLERVVSIRNNTSSSAPTTKAAWKWFKDCLPPRARESPKAFALFSFFKDAEGAEAILRECFQTPFQKEEEDREEAVRVCLRTRGKKLLNERMPALPKTLLREMETLRASRAGSACSGREPTVFPRTNRTDCLGCGCSSFPLIKKPSDISKHHVWRSMYAAQLAHCAQHIDKSRILVLDADELRSRPTRTTNLVLSHLGMKALPYEIDVKEALKRFSNKHPDFAATSGWRINGSNSERDMPPDLRSELDAFFVPHNDALFEWLGVPKFKGWS